MRGNLRRQRGAHGICTVRCKAMDVCKSRGGGEWWELTDTSQATHRLPNVLPQRSQSQEKGFSLVWVLSCL